MTKEEIEKAAEDYDFDGTSKSGYESFIAGAEYRQAEIDELLKSLRLVYMTSITMIIKSINFLKITKNEKRKLCNCFKSC